MFVALGEYPWMRVGEPRKEVALCAKQLIDAAAAPRLVLWFDNP